MSEVGVRTDLPVATPIGCSSPITDIGKEGLHTGAME
jgi:hypothetical protein